MNYDYVRTRRILTTAALALLAPLAFARPVLVGPQRLEVPQLVPEDYPGQHPVSYDTPAIDGDTMLVSATRWFDTSGRQEYGVHLFQRDAGGRWNYVRELVAQSGAVQIGGNVATVATYSGLHIFERGAAGWVQTTYRDTDSGAWDNRDQIFRVDDGSFYVRRDDFQSPPSSCLPPYRQFSKVSGNWTQVATIGGERCVSSFADINDGRAVAVLRQFDDGTPNPPNGIYAPAAGAWTRVGQIAFPPGNPPYVGWYGWRFTFSGTSGFFDGGYLLRKTGGDNWAAAGRLFEPERELDLFSVFGVLRGDSLVVQGHERDYELPTLDPDYLTQWQTLRVYRKRADGFFDYYARLAVDTDVYFWSVSEDGRRVAATSALNNYEGPGTRLYVFEIPDDATFNGTQQDTFEAGHFARWTPTAGEFSVATTGTGASTTRVLRQSSLAGDAGAYLTAVDWQDQSIEADMRPLEFQSNDRWFGLVARRTDARNYYYVTFRASGRISIRRMRDGVYTELAYGYVRAPFTPGRSQRVRFEAVGDQLAVFVDGIPRAHVKDQSFSHGHPGIAGYRTRFDVDDVVVSNANRLLLRLDTWERRWSDGWINTTSGAWSFGADPDGIDVDGDGESEEHYLRQTDTSGDARWFSTVPAGNQVVSARVRPRSFGTTTGDPWVGIAAQVKDEQNYYYVTLRRSNQFSLRRVVNGQVQVINTVSLPVTTGTWYDLRLEVIGKEIRAYVNGDLKISATDSLMTGGGRNALLMYRTAADVYSYIAYQP